MNRNAKLTALLACGATMFQFGGCVADVLQNVLFVVAPVLL